MANPTAAATTGISLSLKDTGELLTSIIKHNLTIGDGVAAGKPWQGEVIVPYLRSAPGVGKTSIGGQVSNALDCNFQSIIWAQFDPSDLAGPLFFDKDTRAVWRAKPQFLPLTGRWVILIDEFGQASGMQKNIAAQLIQERRLGEHILSPHASIILAGNRPQDRAGVTADPSHVLDRVLTINVEANLNDWIDWALSNNIRPEIVAYLRYRSQWFQQFDPGALKNSTPRGWAKCSTILDLKLSNYIEMAALAGQVGDGAATDFHGFLRVFRDLPDPDYLILHPDTAAIPDATKNPNAVYALTGAIAHRLTHKNIAAGITISRRLPPEFGLTLVTDALKRDPSLRNTKDVREWIRKDGAPLLVG